MVMALIDRGWIEANRWWCVFAELPDALFLSEVIDPCCFAIDVDGLCEVGDVGKRDVGVMGEMFGFVEIATCGDPARCTLP